MQQSGPSQTGSAGAGGGGASSPYNFIYSQLVQDPRDMVGIVAYARYKQQKIEWIHGFRAGHGRDPTDGELTYFHQVTNTPTQMQGYRLQAKEIIDQFFESALQQATQEIEEVYQAQLREQIEQIETRHETGSRKVLEEYKQAVSAELPKALPGFWSGVGQNVLANIAVVLLGAVMLLVVWSNRYGLLETLATIGGYKLQPQQEEAASSSSPGVAVPQK